jgi:heat shock protein HslJ
MRALGFAALALMGIAHMGLADGTPPLAETAKMDWVLRSVDENPVEYTATLNLGAPGRVSGQAPCNRYFAEVTQDGDSFHLGLIGATRMICAAAAQETAYFQALQAVETIELMPGTLTLTGAGHVMVFVQPVD